MWSFLYFDNTQIVWGKKILLWSIFLVCKLERSKENTVLISNFFYRFIRIHTFSLRAFYLFLVYFYRTQAYFYESKFPCMEGLIIMNYFTWHSRIFDMSWFAGFKNVHDENSCWWAILPPSDLLNLIDFLFQHSQFKFPLSLPN